MPNLLIIAGANGVGKSTFYESYIEDKKNLSQYINPDKEDQKAVVRKLYEKLENNLDISRETTLTGKKIFQYIEKAKSKSYQIGLIYLLVKDMNICIERIKNRVEQGGHDISLKDVTRRFTDSRKNLLRVIPKIDMGHVIDISTPNPLTIAFIKNGLLKIVNNDPDYLWLEENVQVNS